MSKFPLWIGQCAFVCVCVTSDKFECDPFSRSS